jgi:hypothetical protein
MMARVLLAYCQLAQLLSFDRWVESALTNNPVPDFVELNAVSR